MDELNLRDERQAAALEVEAGVELMVEERVVLSAPHEGDLDPSLFKAGAVLSEQADVFTREEDIHLMTRTYLKDIIEVRLSRALGLDLKVIRDLHEVGIFAPVSNDDF